MKRNVRTYSGRWPYWGNSEAPPWIAKGTTLNRKLHPDLCLRDFMCAACGNDHKTEDHDAVWM